MDKEILKQKLIDLEKEFEKNKRNIYKEFALSHNTYKVGDIFKDHIGSIKIESISIYVSYGEPSCTYTGIELKKDLTPVKKLTKRTAYQTNEVKSL